MDSKNDNGFTLVELLIIVVILCILATISVFAVRGIADRDQKSACIARPTEQAVASAYYPCPI